MMLLVNIDELDRADFGKRKIVRRLFGVRSSPAFPKDQAMIAVSSPAPARSVDAR